MFEFLPFGLAAVLGALLTRRRIKAWPLLLTAIAVGFAATVASGEYLAGWTMLPNDLALATLGAVFGAVARRACAHLSISHLGAASDGTQTTRER